MRRTVLAAMVALGLVAMPASANEHEYDREQRQRLMEVCLSCCLEARVESGNLQAEMDWCFGKCLALSLAGAKELRDRARELME